MSLVRGTLAQPSVKYGRNNVCSQHFWCSTQGCAACRCGYLPSPSRLSPPPLLRVLCSPTCGTSDGSRSIDGRKFERFKKWPLRFGFFLSRGIWKRRSRITRITETDRLLFEAIVTVIEEMMILEELFLRFTSTIRWNSILKFLFYLD